MRHTQRPDARVGFARALYLDKVLQQNARLWHLLPDVAAGRHFDFWLLPPLPQRCEVDILVDLRDRFGVTQAEALRATRLVGLRDPYERVNCYLERGLGHINADKDLRLRHHLCFDRVPRPDPALHDSGSAAQATVRVVAGRT